MRATSAATCSKPASISSGTSCELKNRSRSDRKSTRLNSSHGYISYAVFCLKKKNASSRAGFLAKRFGTRVVYPVLRNVAVHAQFDGVPRPDRRRDGDIQMMTRPHRGWFWFI